MAKECKIFINGKRAWKNRKFETMHKALDFSCDAFITHHVSTKKIEIKCR